MKTKIFAVLVLVFVLMSSVNSQPDLNTLADENPEEYENYILQNPSAVSSNLDAYRTALENDLSLAGRNLQAFETAINQDISIVNQNRESFRVYANTRGVNLFLGEGSSMNNFAGGIFLPNGNEATSFNIEQVNGLIVSEGATGAYIDSQGRLQLIKESFFSSDELMLTISNAKIDGGSISQRGDLPAILKRGDESTKIEKGQIIIGDDVDFLTANSVVSKDTNNDGIYDVTISASKQTALKDSSNCLERNENCVGISGEILVASGDGFEITLHLDEDGEPLHNIRQAFFFPSSKTAGPEIILRESINGEEMISETQFNKFGALFKNGVRPKSLSSFAVEYIKDGNPVTFFGSLQSGSWHYSICDFSFTGSSPQDADFSTCVNWGSDDVFYQGGLSEEFGEPTKVEESTYGMTYEYETKNHGTVRVMVFDPSQVSVIPYVAQNERGSYEKTFLEDMAEEHGGNIFAGVNAAMFDMGTGNPSEAIVVDGEVHGRLRGWDSGLLELDEEGNANIRQVNPYSSEDKRYVDEEVENGVSGILTLQDGQVMEYSENRCGYADKRGVRNYRFCNQRTQRTAIGVMPDGRVMVMTFDRATVRQAGEAMQAMGAESAITLDGGGSTRYYWNGQEVHHRKSENRPVSSGILFEAK